MKAALSGVLGFVQADYADIRVEEIERTRILYRGKTREEVTRSFEVGGCLRVFKNGNWAVASFNRLEGGLKDLAQDTATQVELMSPQDEALVTLPPADEMITMKPDADPTGIPLDAKVDLIHKYNDILLREPRITTTSSLYQDTLVKGYFYSSENRYIAQQKAYSGVALYAVARDGANVQDFGKSFGKTSGFSALLGLEPEIEKIARITLGLLTAEKVRAGKYTVIIDPLLAGVFAHEAFGHLSEADFLYQNERLGELMKIGTLYGIPGLAIVDDGSLALERGSIAFDDEGVPTGKTYLIQDGRIRHHLHSRQTARKMGEDVTGNARALSYRFAPIVRMTNTYIEPRATKLATMLDGIEDGLYVAGARGGMTELESFTFSSQYAYRIENGRRTDKMVRDVVLSGSIFETLKNIDAIGDDLELHGGLGGCGKAGQSPLPTGTGGPHVRIRNVIIGGK
jgi:TldD protein